MISEIGQVLKNSTFYVPLGGAPSLIASPTKVHALVGGGRKVYMSTLKASFFMESLERLLTGPSYTTRKPDKGKGISIGTKDSPVKLIQYLKKPKKVNNIELTKIDIRKVADEEVKVALKGGKDFLKHQAELLKEHNEKVKKLADRKKKLYDQYVWTTTQRRNEGRIIDIRIHPNTKSVTMSVSRNNNVRDFILHKEFTFGYFGISE
nr:hypothetical protein [Tanacetum cinerariifolium]